MLKYVLLLALLFPVVSSAGVVSFAAGVAVGSSGKSTPDMVENISSPPQSLICDSLSDDKNSCSIKFINLSWIEYVSYKTQIPMSKIDIVELKRNIVNGYMRSIIITYKVK